jgi:Prolyl oligopeptidase, N-terminal beta-propeller domain
MLSEIEMKGRIKEDDSSAPDPDGPYSYYVRYRKEGQHPLLCREPRNSLHFPSMQAADVKPEEQLLLDGDALAHGKAFFRLGATRHSPDHRLLAWLADEAGSEFYTARVRVIDSGADLADVVPDASSAVVGLTKTTGPTASFAMGWVRRWLRMCACSQKPIPAFSFQSVAIRRDASAIFRPTITKHRKRGSSIFPHPMPSRRSLPRANPASSTKWNTILPSTAARR